METTGHLCLWLVCLVIIAKSTGLTSSRSQQQKVKVSPFIVLPLSLALPALCCSGDGMTFKRNAVAPEFARLICCQCGRHHLRLLGYNGLEAVNVTVAFHQLQETAAAGLRDTETSLR